MEAVLILAIMAMRVVQSVFSKQVSILMPEGLKAYMKYSATYLGIAAAFAAGVLVCTGDFDGLNLFTALTAGCSGAFLTISLICGIKALSGGTMVLNSVFSAAGLIVPCIIGVFAFDEHISLIQALSIAGVLVSAVLLITASKQTKGTLKLNTLFYLILSLVSNGMVMFCQKLFGMVMPDGNVSAFSLLTFLIPSAVLAISALFMPDTEGNGERKKLPKKLIYCAVYLAFAVFIIQQFVTILTPKMHSAVLFTLVNGSATIITAIVGAILYKEKINIKSAAGIIIGVTALIAMNI